MEKKKKMKRKICLMVAIIFIIIALLIPFVFATTSIPTVKQNSEEKQFFSVDGTTKTAGSTLEMAVNLEIINYNDFLFTLTSSNKALENIDTREADNDIEIERENNSIVINGNKEEMNINEIKLYYQIPQNIEIGTTFTFKATIEENIEKEESKNSTTEEIEVEDNNSNIEENNNEEEQQEKGKKQEIEVTITIVEKVEEEKVEDKNNTNNQNEKQEQSGIEKNNMSIGSVQVNTSSVRTGSNTTAQGETVTYNGSSNNYLKKLSIEGYEFTTNFTKENTNYFIKLDEQVDSLNLTAIAEDDEAKICVYGNEEVEDGKKILISVTAENGSVRTYRIYIIK